MRERECANLLPATLTNDICIDSPRALFASAHNQILRRDKSPDWQRIDILLNVFLAIAVDNLADAESLSDVEKEEGGEVRMIFLLLCFAARRVHCCCMHAIDWETRLAGEGARELRLSTYLSSMWKGSANSITLCWLQGEQNEEACDVEGGEKEVEAGEDEQVDEEGNM